MAMNDTRYSQNYFETYQKRRLLGKKGTKPYLYGFWKRYLRNTDRRGCLLDAGCGLGYFLASVEDLFAESYGIDCSAYAIEQSKAFIGKAVTSVGDIERLPFPDEKFDVVTAFDLVEHLPRPEQFLAEVHRVLKKGGILIMSTPNPDSFGSRKKGNNWFGKRDTSHCSVLPIERWRALLKLGGLAVVKDGTDTLWDVPYYRKIPFIVQWGILISLTWALVWLFGFFRWRHGENYYCIAEKAV